MADGSVRSAKTISSVAREVMDEHDHNKEKALAALLKKAAKDEWLRKGLLRLGAWEALSGVHRTTHTEVWNSAKAAAKESTVSAVRPFRLDNPKLGFDVRFHQLESYYILGKFKIMECVHDQIKEERGKQKQTEATAGKRGLFLDLVMERYTEKHQTKKLEDLASIEDVFKLMVEAQAA